MRGLTSTILLVLALAGLGGYIYFVENKKPAGDAEAKPKVFAVEADQIEEIHINVNGGDATRARRTDQAWRVVEPIDAEADNSELTNIATRFATLDIERVVDESATDLAQYGLSPARLEIAARKKGETAEMRLLVGDKTPTGTTVYAKKPDSAQVFLVSSSADDTFNRSAFDLRDKTVLRFDREKVEGLEIVRNGTTVQFAKKANDWMIVKPAAMRAEFAALEGLVSNLAGMAMQKVVATDVTAAELRTYGLDQPSVSASVITGSTRATIHLGKTEDGATYARDAARPMVMMVAPTTGSDLSKPLSEFRRKELFDMRSFTARRIEITRAAETVVLERTTAGDQDVWKLAGKDVDAAKMEDLLMQVTNLRARSFDDRANPALRTPAMTITAQFGQNKDENRSERVTLARSGSAIVAGRSDEPGTFTVESTAALDELTKALDSLR